VFAIENLASSQFNVQKVEKFRSYIRSAGKVIAVLFSPGYTINGWILPDNVQVVVLYDEGLRLLLGNPIYNYLVEGVILDTVTNELSPPSFLLPENPPVHITNLTIEPTIGEQNLSHETKKRKVIEILSSDDEDPKAQKSYIDLTNPFQKKD